MSAVERLELINDQGDITGLETKDVIYKRGLKNFRIVEVFLRNPAGHLFIARRARKKTLLPGLYENCGEHILPGESDARAARRGVREEFGIDLPSLQFLFLGYTTPSEGAYGHASTFLAVTDRTPQLSHEHDWGAWLTPLDIVHMVRKDPRQFRHNVRILFSKYARELF